jgi:hypothetical protein
MGKIFLISVWLCLFVMSKYGGNEWR